MEKTPLIRVAIPPQENVKRVQLANEYLDGASLAGATGSSMPEAIAKEISQVRWI